MSNKHEGHEFLIMLVAGNLFLDTVDAIRLSKHKDVIRQRVKKRVNDTLEALEKDCKPMYDIVFKTKEMHDYYEAMLSAMTDITGAMIEVPVEKWPELYAVVKSFADGELTIVEEKSVEATDKLIIAEQ